MHNEIIEGEGFYVSYLFPSHTPLGNVKGETALVKDGKYYILDGDWRQEYKSIIDKGFDKAYELFADNPAKMGFWSDTPSEETK